MVVRQENARAAAQRRVPDDGSQREGRTAGVAFMPGHMQAVGVDIDMRHPQPLPSKIGLGKAASKEGAGGRQSVQLEWPSGTLWAHTA